MAIDFHIVYILCIHIFFLLCFQKLSVFLQNFFSATNSEKGNFNYVKKVQLPVAIQRIVRFTKFS